MSLNDDFKKAAQLERAALDKLNQEEGWVEKHPGWISIGALFALGFIIVLALKACHG